MPRGCGTRAARWSLSLVSMAVAELGYAFLLYFIYPRLV